MYGRLCQNTYFSAAERIKIDIQKGRKQMNQAYQVKLDTFEGPLDLLLHLINQYEIDIYDIPVATITEQYMQYIHTMQRLELNIASEYLVMASTLLVIKSEMLLPKQEITEEPDDYEEDPREELMQRLIEYRKYKEAAEQLKWRESEESQTFTRPPVALEEKKSRTAIDRGNISIYDMLYALDKVFERKRWDEHGEKTLKREEIPIEHRMQEVMEHVRQSKFGVTFDQLFIHHSRPHIVATFMALLELIKNNKVYCRQEKQFDVLYVFQMED